MAYFPNATAGHVLDAQCFECPLGNLPCPTALAHLRFNYQQVDPAQSNLRKVLTVLVDEEGTCETRRLLVNAETAAPPPRVVREYETQDGRLVRACATCSSWHGIGECTALPPEGHR